MDIRYTLESRIINMESEIRHFFSCKLQCLTVCWMNEIIRLSENEYIKLEALY